MRETRQSGSEGGGNETNRFSLPLSSIPSDPLFRAASLLLNPVIREIRGWSCRFSLRAPRFRLRGMSPARLLLRFYRNLGYCRSTRGAHG